jgi:hypothetical protein
MGEYCGSVTADTLEQASLLRSHSQREYTQSRLKVWTAWSAHRDGMTELLDT